MHAALGVGRMLQVQFAERRLEPLQQCRRRIDVSEGEREPGRLRSQPGGKPVIAIFPQPPANMLGEARSRRDQPGFSGDIELRSPDLLERLPWIYFGNRRTPVISSVQTCVGMIQRSLSRGGPAEGDHFIRTSSMVAKLSEISKPSGVTRQRV